MTVNVLCGAFTREKENDLSAGGLSVKILYIFWGADCVEQPSSFFSLPNFSTGTSTPWIQQQ